MSQILALHLKSLRDAGFVFEASFFENHIAGLNARREHALLDARVVSAERDQWRARCLELKRQYGVRSAEPPREHNERLTYEYEGDGSRP